MDYDLYFGRALQQIKSIRAPHSNMQEKIDLGWDKVCSNEIFSFGGVGFRKIQSVIDSSRKISIMCSKAIIEGLAHEKNINLEEIKIENVDERSSEIYFAYIVKNSSSLVIFKDIEQSNFWKNKEPEFIDNILKKNGLERCQYIYLMYDQAYLQVVGHNDDVNDAGRGYNLYSLPWFVRTYFGDTEGDEFEHSLKQYVEDVNAQIGYIFVKALTPYSLKNFKLISESKIRKHSYDKLLGIKAKDYELSETAFVEISKQFLNDGKYQLLLGNNDFSESLITAEWLLDSMDKAKAIDLTIIGTGYFKAVEQLLYELICLHKNQGRMIKKDFSFKELPQMIELNDQNIEGKCIDFTIGAMANFVKDNLDMMNDSLGFRNKKYIRETIFDYKDLRNGYFHKHNIHDIKVIEKIREKSLYLIFLLLGSFKLSDNDIVSLGLPSDFGKTDFQKLCEYVDYHSNQIFFLIAKDGREMLFIGCTDQNSFINDKGYIEYTGLYFKDVGPSQRKYTIQENGLPEKIYLGKLDIKNSETIQFEPKKEKLIWEAGRFVGPLIADELGGDY